METKIINILIVEDHEIARFGLKYTLEKELDFKIKGEACSGSDAINKVRQIQPDLVLMDIGLPEVDGIEATRAIKELYPSVKVLMLTSYNTDKEVLAAFSAGADGYCFKDAPRGRLATAVRSVADGAAWIDPGIAQKIISVLSSSDSHGGDSNDLHKSTVLSPREIDVLRLLIDGASNREMADQLKLTPETIKSHMRNIMSKLKVADRTQAAVKALKEGLI